MTTTTRRLPATAATLFKLSAASVLAVLLATGIAQQAQAQPQTAMQHRMAEPGVGPVGMGMGMGMGMGHHGGLLSERLLNDIGATAEQKASLRQIYQAARADLRAQHQGGAGMQQQMLQLLAAPQVDAAAAEALRQQQLARHDAASKRMLQALLEAQAVLTPEQRQKLAERIAARDKALQQRHDRRHADTPRG